MVASRLRVTIEQFTENFAVKCVDRKTMAADNEPGRFVDFNALSTDTQELVREAVTARTFSFCKYSNFAVGAALRSDKNVIFRGCNIESCAYSPTICAERTAMCKGISEGHLKFTEVAVIADSKDITMPCGVCRQLLCEFSNSDMAVYAANPEMKQVYCVQLKELLPLPFISL